MASILMKIFLATALMAASPNPTPTRRPTPISKQAHIAQVRAWVKAHHVSPTPAPTPRRHPNLS